MLQINCPSCGTPVQFRSESSVYATCASCQSLLVRQDVNLEAIGKVADLQPDGTPLQIDTSGVYNGVAFQVLGRIQIRYADGYWNEWYLQFADGRNGWLGEAMGEYLVSFALKAEGLPDYDALRVGHALKLDGTEFVVTNLAAAQAVSFEGELPFVMKTGYDLPFADLRSASRRAATLDYSEDQPLLFLGEFRDFQELELKGLRDPEVELESHSAANTRVLRCPSCGAPHELTGGPRSQTLVCQFCDAAIDLTDPTYKILWKAENAPKVEPSVPIGAKGKLDGVEWECLGFQRRYVSVEGIRYYWSEYLLHNPWRGYRFLTESQGHWSLLAVTQALPVASDGHPVFGWPPQDFLVDSGRKYRHFQSAKGIVAYVAGEFPWRVRVDTEAMLHDYVCPPDILSAEVDEQGMVWSRGRYCTPSEVWEAFKLPGAPPPQTGVAPNQPSPFAGTVKSVWTQYALFGLLGFILMVFFSMTGGTQVFTKRFEVKTGEEPSVVTTPFKLEGRKANVAVDLVTNLDNRWAFFEMALINEDTREALAFSKGVSYYHGVDGGESWSEGSQKGYVVVPSVPSGTYVLRVEPQTGTGDQAEKLQPGGEVKPVFNYDVTIRRDVPQWGWYWLGVLFLLIYPVYASIRQAGFEQKRWLESDHPPASSSE